MPRNPDDIRFAPVPVRARRDGWTPEVQRAFIRALQRCGSVTAACKAVGRSPRSAYNLAAHPQALSFVNAWSKAAWRGRENMRDAVIDRCMHGATVPVIRKGKEVGTERRYYDRLAIAVLSHRDVDFEQQQAQRQYDRAYRYSQELKALREREAAALAEAERRALDAEARLDQAPAEPEKDADANTPVRKGPGIRLL